MVIHAGIEHERLVGPLGERVGVDQAGRPRCLEAGHQRRRLLEQRLHDHAIAPIGRPCPAGAFPR